MFDAWINSDYKGINGKNCMVVMNPDLTFEYAFEQSWTPAILHPGLDPAFSDFHITGKHDGPIERAVFQL
jgi:hypothetical protein